MINRIVIIPKPGFQLGHTYIPERKIEINNLYKLNDFCEKLDEHLELPVMVIDDDYEYCDSDLVICWKNTLEQIIACLDNNVGKINCILISFNRDQREVLKEAAFYSLVAVINEWSFAVWNRECVHSICGFNKFKKYIDSNNNIYCEGNESQEYIIYSSSQGETLIRLLSGYIEAWLKFAD